MPRPRSQEPSDRQLLIRVTARQMEVLESVAHLERSAPNRYVRQLLIAHLATLERNEFVQADLANRAAYASAASLAIPLRTPPRDGASEDPATGEQAPTGVQPSRRAPRRR
jgi:hypothetical protein